MSSENPTMQEVFEDFLLSRIANGAKKVTVKSYKGHFHSISKHLNVEQPINLVTKKEIESMVVSMRRSGLSNASIQTYTRCLRIFLNWVHTEGLAEDVNVKLYRADKTMKEPYTDEELIKLLAYPAANCNFWELRDWTMINFLINSGCRSATLRAILIKDVDFNHKLIYFRHTKNGCPQAMPLCEEMVVILRFYLSVRAGLTDEELFCNDHYQPLTHSALRKTIIKYNTSRGVSKTSIHLFRHTFAKKFLLDCDGDAFTLQQLLGHKSLEMTKRYCNLYNSDIANRFELICPLSKMHQQTLSLKVD